MHSIVTILFGPGLKGPGWSAKGYKKAGRARVNICKCHTSHLCKNIEIVVGFEKCYMCTSMRKVYMVHTKIGKYFNF